MNQPQAPSQSDTSSALADREADYLFNLEKEAAKNWKLRYNELMEILTNPPVVVNDDGSVNATASRALNQQRQEILDQSHPIPLPPDRPWFRLTPEEQTDLPLHPLPPEGSR